MISRFWNVNKQGSIDPGRLERILTMVYVVQSYWAYFGLYPSSCMWKTKKYQNVSETGSVSVLRWMGQDKPTQLGPLERASLNHWTFCYFVFHIQDDG
jgi:hypothetical protein